MPLLTYAAAREYVEGYYEGAEGFRLRAVQSMRRERRDGFTFIVVTVTVDYDDGTSEPITWDVWEEHDGADTFLMGEF